jgi:hypothetical protein
MSPRHLKHAEDVVSSSVGGAGRRCRPDRAPRLRLTVIPVERADAWHASHVFAHLALTSNQNALPRTRHHPPAKRISVMTRPWIISSSKCLCGPPPARCSRCTSSRCIISMVRRGDSHHAVRANGGQPFPSSYPESADRLDPTANLPTWANQCAVCWCSLRCARRFQSIVLRPSAL